MTPAEAAEIYVATVLSRIKLPAGGGEAADFAVLYMPRGRDHDLAVSLGLLDLPRAAYTELYGLVRERLEAASVPVRVCRASPAEVISALQRWRLPNDPQGRSEAFARLAARAR